MSGAEGAQQLREIHQRGAGVVVPNAWDTASARALALQDFPTIATSSAAVAWAAGYADGQQLPFESLVETVRSITAAVDIPLSVDAEGGYAEATGSVGATIEALIGAGAAGVNLEDGSFDDPTRLRDADQHAEVIAEARATADRLDSPLWINGRTDVFWKGIGEAADRPAAAAERLRRYREAGADCAFSPGLADESDIRSVVDAVDGPLNVMRMPGMTSAQKLGALGVARITLGADLILAAMAQLERIANLLKGGDLATIDEARPTPELLQALLGG